MTPDNLKKVLTDHKLWLRGYGGKRADLAYVNLAHADLSYTNLSYANLAGADFGRVDFSYAYLTEANLACANLSYANFVGANLEGVNLEGVNLTGAYLNGVIGNMREIRSIQIDTWPVAYTADTLQIGCQRHPIAKWRNWSTDAGRKWITVMDHKALEWADRNLALILQIIDANPATPTGHEKDETDE